MQIFKNVVFNVFYIFYAIQDFQEFFQSEDLLQVYFQIKSLQKGHKKVSLLTFIKGTGVEKKTN